MFSVTPSNANSSASENNTTYTSVVSDLLKCVFYQLHTVQNVCPNTLSRNNTIVQTTWPLNLVYVIAIDYSVNRPNSDITSHVFFANLWKITNMLKLH
jgi:hypothetical protein